MHEETRQQLERYARQMMTGEIAHDFKHADRVRRWALHIAHQEGFEALALVEAAALLHDIGLAHVEERSRHAQVGAEMAAAFLRERRLFAEDEIEEIAHAIRFHSSLNGGGRLLEILRDADMLDLFGAVGLMRACASMHAKPEYDPRNVKGETWGMPASAFTRRFAEGRGAGDYIVDQINFQISCYDNLSTTAARRAAAPLVEFMRAYIVQLDAEVMDNTIYSNQ
jgi:putative nucleotidyltransferase with HDIG domain